MYVCTVCPSRSSTHAHEDAGGVTCVCGIRSLSRGWRSPAIETMDGGPAGGETSQSTSAYSEPFPSYHPHTMLFTARGICLRTLRIPSYTVCVKWALIIECMHDVS